MENKKFRMSEVIPLWLEGYDDIFSDFDSRSYSHRALSVDFLDEAKRASKDKPGGIDLKLLLDKKKRNAKSETMIKKRLREHFMHHHQMLENERKKLMGKGMYLLMLGILIMIFTTFVLFSFGESSVSTTFLIVLLEPAGWFLFWEGLNLVVFESKKETRDLRFYDKMAKCRIEFVSD
jgi:hypothetical protein